MEKFITREDFEKAKKALEEANVPGPWSYTTLNATMPLERPEKPVQAFLEGES